MQIVFVERDAQGKIISVNTTPQQGGKNERIGLDDSEVQAFLNPPPADPDDIIDTTDSAPGINRALIGAIAELTGNTRGQVVAAMKRNK